MRILVSSESGATSADALKLHLALLEESSSSIDAAVVAVASEAELKGLGKEWREPTN